MKLFAQRYYCTIFALTFFAVAFATAAEKSAIPIAFDAHTGYFVSNQFEPKVKTSFIVFQDQKTFDQVFGTAMVMRDKSHRLAPGASEKKMVMAVIHRGKAVVRYNIESVTIEDKTIILQYTTKIGPLDTAEFACPLILSLGKGEYKAVRFIENGKEIKKLTIRSMAGPRTN